MVGGWRKRNFKVGKGVWNKKVWLFLICVHTHQLVPCEKNGRGYDIERAQKWVCMTVHLAKLAFQVTCASLVAAAVTQFPATTLGGVGEQVVEIVFTSLRAK